MTSREAVQTAEDARLITLKNQADARLAAERAASASREATANAAAANARADANDAERARDAAQAQADRTRLDAKLAAQRAADEAKALAERVKADAERQSWMRTRAGPASRTRQAGRRSGKPAGERRTPRHSRNARSRNCATNWRDSSTRSFKRRTAPGASSSTCPTFSSTPASFRLSPARGEAGEDLRHRPGIPQPMLEVEGHTDSVGSDDSIIRLSENRASSVRDFLIARELSRTSIGIPWIRRRPTGGNQRYRIRPAAESPRGVGRFG